MVTKEQRKRIAEVAKYRCGYCLMQEVISGIPLTSSILRLKPKAAKMKMQIYGYHVVYAMRRKA